MLQGRLFGKWQRILLRSQARGRHAATTVLGERLLTGTAFAGMVSGVINRRMILSSLDFGIQWFFFLILL